ncbi:MAG: hypothetical protein QXO33_04755, partial [Nitrososphaeria archaeon]
MSSIKIHPRTVLDNYGFVDQNDNASESAIISAVRDPSAINYIYNIDPYGSSITFGLGSYTLPQGIDTIVVNLTWSSTLSSSYPSGVLYLAFYDGTQWRGYYEYVSLPTSLTSQTFT